MDQKTKDSYNKNANEIEKLHSGIKPTRLYDLAKTYFKTDSLTLDLGCGIGRDTIWLNENHYQASGCDFSNELLKIAKSKNSKINFFQEELPSLKSIDDNTFDNVFSSAVLQHIPRSELIEAIRNILRISKPGARIILSFRGTKNLNNREDDKLYENYQIGQIASIFESFGSHVLIEEISEDLNRDLIWNTIVCEKVTLDKKSGIERIQDIIQRDSKTSTYKFALIRALCEISRYESHIVCWSRENDLALIPIKRIAIRWLSYYFPLLKNNLKQTTNPKLKFEDALRELNYKNSDLYLFLKDLETEKSLNKLIKLVSDAIIKGPIKYSGGEKTPHFGFMSKLDAKLYPDLLESDCGMIAVPLPIWRDINLYSHWIEDSLVLQWVYMTSELNNSKNISQYFELHSQNYLKPERDTYNIRKLYKNKNPICIWTGKSLSTFDVDHMIPWSVWHNNDLWNLLPCDPKTNLIKSNKLPSSKLIEKSFDHIKYHWEIYANNFEELFKSQLKYSLGLDLNAAFTSEARDALNQTIDRIHVRTGAEYFK